MLWQKKRVAAMQKQKTERLVVDCERVHKENDMDTVVDDAEERTRL